MSIVRKKRIVATLLCLAAANALADTLPVQPNLKGTIVVTIHGFNNEKAKAMIAVHHTKKTFLKKVEPYRKAISPISGDTVVETFEGLPFGEYAVAVFQDDNQNMDLDMTKLFIPKEKYGFSNNPKIKYGPPSFNDAKFALESEKMEISITLQ